MSSAKVALVTGAAAGIGAGTAERFSEAGYAVAVFDVNGDGGRAMAERLRARGPAIAIAGDVASEDDAREAVERTVAELGAIVQISSVHAFVSWPGSSAYDATKAGLLGLARAMALDHGPEGIRVNVICPGYIRTPLMGRCLDDLPDPDAALHWGSGGRGAGSYAGWPGVRGDLAVSPVFRRASPPVPGVSAPALDTLWSCWNDHEHDFHSPCNRSCARHDSC